MVSGLRFAKLRYLGTAAIGRIGTARAEFAPFGGVLDAGQLPLHYKTLPLPLRVGIRHRAEQHLRIGMLGVIENGFLVGEFHHAAQIHHRDPVAQMLYDPQVMADKQIGKPCMDHGYFTHDHVNMEILRQRSYSMRWATLAPDVIPLSSADPDFPPAPEIIRELNDYLKGGYMPYVPPLGITGLRESIASGLKLRKNENVKPEWIIPTDSAARAMQIISAAVLQPGDEAIIFDPVDLMFGVSISMANAKPVCFPCTKKDGHWDFSQLESYISEKTKMLCLCNPHNPLGKLYSVEELAQILRIANQHDLVIMNDEVWSDIVYSETPFHSLMEFPSEQTRKVLTVYGFSKGFSMAGIRGGYLICPDEALFSRIFDASAVGTTVGGVSCLTQVAMKAAFDHAFYWVDEFVAHLQACRDYVCDRLNAMPGITAERQEATFVSFFDMHRTGLTAEEFARQIYETDRVYLVPGTDKWFGPGAGGHVRLCYATSHEILEQALDRIENGVKRMMR